MGCVLTHGMMMFITTRLKGVKKGTLPVSNKSGQLTLGLDPTPPSSKHDPHTCKDIKIQACEGPCQPTAHGPGLVRISHQGLPCWLCSLVLRHRHLYLPMTS